MKKLIKLLIALTVLVTVGIQAQAEVWDTDSPANGVPVLYSKVTASGNAFLIQKGQLNKLRLRPQIINEHAESSRNIIGTVTASTIVGQIFKASQDNINGINMAVESAAGIDFDDFESYADTTALQVEWIATNAAKKAELETVIVNTGDKSMKLPTSGAPGDEWGKDFASTDFTDYTGQFYMYATHSLSFMAMRVYVKDSSGYYSSADIITAGVDQWFKYVFDTGFLTPDVPANVTDLTDIIEIGVRVTDSQPNSFVYIDDMVSVPNPGSIILKLWDMGATIPASTVDALDDGTQYEKLGDAGISGLQASSLTLKLLGGKRMYHIDGFVAGPALEIPSNELLTMGNYYAITLHYVDTNTSVYGPDPSIDDYYSNGYAFTAPDESTAITATGAGEDLMFLIFSTQDVYIAQFLQFIDAAPNGGSDTSLFIEDLNMAVTDILISGVRGQQTVIQNLPRPYLMEKGGKFEQYYNDDFTDNVTEISLSMQYYFELKPTNNNP